ncbi:helix-turn-helix transcriptional regulator [Clostridium manihotivorum]|uniref:HTH cro/C1-type domain-containing protein n=1 Tax=Clostridium manihotivorum TaxID=2320868 RepID=A0A3R5UAV6_9CLOT|nr:helix-turn-helix transcriptional regulator [Clostridium manihotivorum]QAA34011.1 hypothetical protein C1I91_21615 [Clostridium manihotivorum]
MEFYNPSEKIKLMRKKFRVNQAELEGLNMTRAFISMMESGKRTVSKASSKALAEKFNNIAKRISVNLDLDDEYFSRTPKEDARFYCEEQLKKELDFNQLQELIKIAKEFELDDLLAQVYKVLGDKRYKKKEYVEAALYLRKALGKFKELRDDKSQIKVYFSLGLCKRNNGEYEDAIQYFEDSITYALDERDMKTYYKSNVNIATTYCQLNEFDKCLYIIDNSILNHSSEIEFEILCFAKITKATVLYKLEEYEGALKEFFNLVDLVNGKDDSNLAKIYNDIAECYYSLGEYDNSLKYIEKSQQVTLKIDKASLPYTLNTKGKILFKNNLYSESILILNLAIDIAEQYKNIDALLQSYKDLVKVYESKQDYTSITKVMNKLLETLDNFDTSLGRSYAMLKLTEASVHLDDKEEAVSLLNKLENLMV